ncbi:hypothetical protein TNCV_273071 [Trichonephila clavipes]|nr:hypothetical protein TNCV_273071 [Trichonephila clavipes]
MGVQKLNWSSQSPDLNPIEHLWDELERRLRIQPNRPSSLQALTSAVMDAWMAIPISHQSKMGDTILWLVVLLFMARYSGVSFQQDNAIPHTTRIPLDCLCAVNTLPWASRSPDISPIERLGYGRVPESGTPKYRRSVSTSGKCLENCLAE